MAVNQEDDFEICKSDNNKGLPVIITCSTCDRIVTDSTEWLFHCEKKKIITTRSITNHVTIKDGILLTTEDNQGSTYSLLECKCKNILGRIYRSTPRQLDLIRDLYTLDVFAVDSYQVGGSDNRQGPDLQNLKIPTIPNLQTQMEQPYESAYNTRNSDPKQIKLTDGGFRGKVQSVPSHLYKSFEYVAPKLWNDLPDKIQSELFNLADRVTKIENDECTTFDESRSIENIENASGEDADSSESGTESGITTISHNHSKTALSLRNSDNNVSKNTSNNLTRDPLPLLDKCGSSKDVKPHIDNMQKKQDLSTSEELLMYEKREMKKNFMDRTSKYSQLDKKSAKRKQNRDRSSAGEKSMKRKKVVD